MKLRIIHSVDNRVAHLEDRAQPVYGFIQYKKFLSKYTITYDYLNLFPHRWSDWL